MAKLRKPVTMRLSEDVIGYFKQKAEEKDVPCQSLINLYLRACVASLRKIDIPWQAAEPS
ncbi:MAG TPA: CopG family antitoxin [Gallionellaceae bacterium]|nr:CopG family antitoxin [Gallionellaceae bacterium]